MLRCFNDGVAMGLLYFAVLLFLANRWKLGSLAFSLAVSVKMNVLLFAPGLLLLYLRRFGLAGAMVNLSICAAVQLVLGLPFLLTYPYSYVKGAFDFGRVFTYIWTVNFKFLPEDVFVNPLLGKGLLLVHLTLLGYFIYRRERRFPFAITGPTAGAAAASPAAAAQGGNLAPTWIVDTLMLSNFIGFVCARSLHFQFYVWVFHSLPFLLWTTSISNSLK